MFFSQPLLTSAAQHLAATAACMSVPQEVVLLQQQADAHMAAFNRVQWDKLADEHFGGSRTPAKLRTVYNMLQRAGVSGWCWRTVYACPAHAALTLTVIVDKTHQVHRKQLVAMQGSVLQW
jgi:hypothetical protein